MLSILERTSAPKINRAGESGPPCLRPLVEWKNPCLVPFTITKYQLLLMILQRRSIKVSPKPILLSTKQVYDQDTLSYALVISSLITTLSPSLGFLMLWVISCSSIMFSDMLQPLTEPYWFWEINWGRIKSNNKILEIILFEKLLKLKSWR